MCIFTESEAPFDYSNSKKRLVNEVLNYKPRYGARSADAEDNVVRNDDDDCCFFISINIHFIATQWISSFLLSIRFIYHLFESWNEII